MGGGSGRGVCTVVAGATGVSRGGGGKEAPARGRAGGRARRTPGQPRGCGRGASALKPKRRRGWHPSDGGRRGEGWGGNRPGCMDGHATAGLHPHQPRTRGWHRRGGNGGARADARATGRQWRGPPPRRGDEAGRRQRRPGCAGCRGPGRPPRAPPPAAPPALHQRRAVGTWDTARGGHPPPHPTPAATAVCCATGTPATEGLGAPPRRACVQQPGVAGVPPTCATAAAGGGRRHSKAGRPPPPRGAGPPKATRRAPKARGGGGGGWDSRTGGGGRAGPRRAHPRGDSKGATTKVGIYRRF